MFGWFKGTVKWFDPRPDKRFGFVVCGGFVDGSEADENAGREFFFHFNDGEFPTVGRKGPEFVERKQILSSRGHRGLREPKPGDEIVFTLSLGKDGKYSKARPWCYLSRYEAIMNEIASLPVYRVLEGSGAWGKSPSPENPVGSKVRWLGSDLQELNMLFPLPNGRQSPGSDPLLPFWSSDDGFEVRRWWEKQNADGTWTQCEDPRDLPGVLRQFERISNR